MSTVSVVMVSYHTGVSLWLAIDAVLDQPECRELILVNNGNPAGTEALLKERARKEPRLRVISGHGNVGFAKACNIGAKGARGDYLLLLNPDAMLPAGALAKALEHMRHQPANTLAGCFLANPSGTEQRGGRRALLTPVNAVAESLGLSGLLPQKERLNLHYTPMPETVQEVPAISGAFMLMAREFYTSLKGMDERYFLHMEDMDFCYRVHEKGGRIIIMPDVKVVHFHSTSEVPSSFVEKQKTDSFILYLETHFAPKGAAGTVAFIALGLRVRYYLKRVIHAVNRWFKAPMRAKQEIARLVLLYRLTRFMPQSDALSGKTVMVTGASGQLGLALVAQMLCRGAKVIAITHRTRVDFTHPNLTWAERDLARDKKALASAQVDMVLHAAELGFLPKFLPGLAADGAKRVVAFGCLPLLEKVNSATASDRSDAKRHKALGEELHASAREHECDFTLFYVCGMYGAGLDNGLTKQADTIRRFGALPIEPTGKGLRQPVHVLDVAEAVMQALFNPATFGKTYRIGGAATLSYLNMLMQLFEYVGKPPKLVRLPGLPRVLQVMGRIYAVNHISADMMLQMNRDVIANNEEAVSDFGYHPRGYLEGETGL